MTHLSILLIHESPLLVLQVLAFEGVQISRCFLDLLSSDLWCNDEQCVTLSSLPLVTQCKSLALAVQTRSCVVDLVKKLTNLQALNILCQDEEWNLRQDPTQDELVIWFRENLPSTCIIGRSTGDRIVGMWIY